MPNDLLSRLNSALEFDVANRHSLFQLKHFILGKETTLHGRIWQCLREMRVRKDALDSVALEIEESKDKIELLHIDVSVSERSLNSAAVSEADAKRGQILHRMLLRQVHAATMALAALEEKRQGYEVEAAFFVEEFEKLSAVTSVKALDDEEAQKEYWTAKLFQEVHLKSLLGQPLETDLVKTVLSLPEDSPVKAQMLAFLTSIRDAKVKAVSGEQLNTAALTK
jgi:hypothetical protein